MLQAALDPPNKNKTIPTHNKTTKNASTFFMDEEDLSSSSSRHYYPYQPHPPSITGVDAAFPFEFSSG